MQVCVRTASQILRPANLHTALSLAKASSQLRRYASVSAAELQFGQPLHETHPHLLKAGERKKYPLMLSESH